ncbi:MAG: U32 family peptidase C-terminal domain-containing protein, partial [Oscillospiraceae bacterium]
IGVLGVAKEIAPEIDVHISTQAGIVNHLTANEFYKMGAKRIVLARELSFDEITFIRQNTPPDLEIEAFVHGAMCMSVSGRCLLSDYMVGRDANRGACAQPCRWGYHLVEEKRPGEYYQLFEDEQGSYILNAKDMCMIEHIDLLAKSGITSLKIEGRAKSAYYVATITNAYRNAVDIFYKNPSAYYCPDWLIRETQLVSHRRYTTGFYFGRQKDSQYYENGGYLRQCDIVGIVKQHLNGMLYCQQKNKFNVNDEIEILIPKQQSKKLIVQEILNEEKENIKSANHAHMYFYLKYNGENIPSGSILRMMKKES